MFIQSITLHQAALPGVLIERPKSVSGVFVQLHNRVFFICKASLEMVIGATLYSGTILYNSINQCMFIPTLIRILNNKKNQRQQIHRY